MVTCAMRRSKLEADFTIGDDLVPRKLDRMLCDASDSGFRARTEFACRCRGGGRTQVLRPSGGPLGVFGQHGHGESILMHRYRRDSQMPSSGFQGPWHRLDLEGTVFVAFRG